MRTIALDLGKNSIDWCEVKAGQVLARGRVSRLEALAPIVGVGTGPAVVGFEACRESRHVHDVISSWGQTPRMFDTTRVRRLAGVGEHGRKNDRLDAEKLALALERGHAAFAYVLSDDGRELRELQEIHRALVGARKNAVIHARGLLQGRGVILPGCEPDYFVGHVRKAQLPPSLRLLVEPLLGPLEAIEPELARVGLRILELCKKQKSQAVERLASVPGVSLLVAASFISAIDDPGRFQNASQVASYLGLCPLENTTGGRRKLGSITKQGNAYARAMLVQSAWCVIRSRDTKDPLVHWSHRTAQRRGRMRAAVAVARRLARILWSLWQHGSYYDPYERVPLNDEKQANQLKAQEQARKRGVLKLSRQQRVRERVLQLVAARQGGATAQ
jgi:transposase